MRTENPDAGETAENHQIEDKLQLIHDGNARHLVRADLADHDVVKHTDKIRDAVLNHDRNRDLQCVTIKIPCSEIT